MLSDIYIYIPFNMDKQAKVLYKKKNYTKKHQCSKWVILISFFLLPGIF